MYIQEWGCKAKLKQFKEYRGHYEMIGFYLTAKFPKYHFAQFTDLAQVNELIIF